MASHVFPHYFIKAEQGVGLASAAIVLSFRDSSESPLMSLGNNHPLRPGSPAIASKDPSFFNCYLSYGCIYNTSYFNRLQGFPTNRSSPSSTT
ncbi:hypothetical protein ACLOJK_028143 [Asimina triloba]